MGRALTNNTVLAYGRQPALDVDPLIFHLLEPNDITTLGASITTIARNPISRNRQRRKGTTTDLDSSVEFEHDLTLSVFLDFFEGFCFANATNRDLSFRASPVTATGFSIPAATAAQAAKLQFTAGGPISLLYSRGYTTPANDGFKELSADLLEGETEIQVAGLTPEPAVPFNSYVDVAGIRAALDDLSVDVTGTVVELKSGGGVGTQLDFTTLGLTVGQFIHIGGLDAASQFDTGPAYIQIQSITPASIVARNRDGSLLTDPGTGKNIELLFGRFVRNVTVDDPEFLEQYYTFEATFDNLAEPGPGDEYEYPVNNISNTMEISLNLADKATVTFGFVGTDTLPPTPDRKPTAQDPIEPQGTTAFNTSVDIARLIVKGLDEQGITTDFKSLTLTLNNNVSAEKVLATLGARFLNNGNFDVDLETQLLFTDSGVSRAIRNNTTVSLNMRLVNDDGAIYFDIPSLTLSGGDREYPVNETVLANITGEAFADPILNTSIGASLFPIVPSTTAV